MEKECLALGAVDVVTKPLNPLVVRSRINAVIRLHESTRTLTALEYDDLTGLYTRQAFYHYAHLMLERNPDTRYDLVVSDIDDFRMVNDQYGEATGDAVLRHISLFFRRYLPPDTLAGRLGGDQFVCITPHDDRYCTEESLTALLSMLSKDGPVPHLESKFGIYDNVDHQLPVSVLVDRAMLALKTIKHRYGVLCARYDEALEKKRERQKHIESIMKQALDEGQFQVYFQPKHDARTGALVGAEALVRWMHPEYGFMSPGEFVPLFERNGFITEIDAFVWRRTCRSLRKWLDAGLPVVPVSVNISRMDLVLPDFLSRLCEPVSQYSIPEKYLHIEVTESLFADRMEELVSTLSRCHELGFLVELDDFGTGYSSLNILGELPLDMVKLDMSFVRSMEDPHRARIVNGMVRLTHSLGLRAIAEGVETEEQLNALRNIGIDAIQGYYYAKPMRETDFETYLANV